LRSILVSGEIALSVVLLVGSALLLRSLRYTQHINPGFDPNKNVLMLSVAPPQFYGYNDAQAAAIYPELAARAETVPGVIRASYARRPPLATYEGGEKQAVVIPGIQPPPGTDHFAIRFNTVGPTFFATIGARLEEGREFNQFDLPSAAPVVMINDAMARKFWPGQSPLGKALQIDKNERQIVGVVEAGRYNAIHEEVQPYVFLPFTQVSSFECLLFVETAGDPRALIPAIVKEASSAAKNLPIVSAVTLREHMNEVMADDLAMANLLGSLSVLGMFLAAVGLYAAVAYLVTRRTHELGIRMALGARRGDVLKLVLAQGLRLSAAGAAVGLVGAFAASRLMSGFIYGVTATDPLSYAASTLLAISVALLACYIPARRATKVDPLVALRYE
jgi:predicted permease